MQGNEGRDKRKVPQMTGMTVSETLNKAADLIEERGWTSGGGWHDLNGSEPLCIEGAIAAARGDSSALTSPPCDAYHAVRSYLGGVPPWTWNDHLMHGNVVDDPAEQRRGWVRGSREAAYEYATGRVLATLRATALVAAANESQPNVEAVRA